MVLVGTDGKHKRQGGINLRYYNEVSKNDDLLDNDGLSTLEFVEHGKTKNNNITHINVGI